MFKCSRCDREKSGPMFECPKCRDDFCWNCAAESAGQCLKCGVTLSPFRPPAAPHNFEFVPSSE